MRILIWILYLGNMQLLCLGDEFLVGMYLRQAEPQLELAKLEAWFMSSNLGLGELGKMKLELGSSKARAWVRLVQGSFETQV